MVAQPIPPWSRAVLPLPVIIMVSLPRSRHGGNQCEVKIKASFLIVGVAPLFVEKSLRFNPTASGVPGW